MRVTFATLLLVAARLKVVDHNLREHEDKDDDKKVAVTAAVNDDKKALELAREAKEGANLHFSDLKARADAINEATLATLRDLEMPGPSSFVEIESTKGMSKEQLDAQMDSWLAELKKMGEMKVSLDDVAPPKISFDELEKKIHALELVTSGVPTGSLIETTADSNKAPPSFDAIEAKLEKLEETTKARASIDREQAAGFTQEMKNVMNPSSFVQLSQTDDHVPSWEENSRAVASEDAELEAFTRRTRAQIAALKDGHHTVASALQIGAASDAGAAVEAAAEAAGAPSSFIQMERPSGVGQVRGSSFDELASKIRKPDPLDKALNDLSEIEVDMHKIPKNLGETYKEMTQVMPNGKMRAMGGE